MSKKEKEPSQEIQTLAVDNIDRGRMVSEMNAAIGRMAMDAIRRPGVKLDRTVTATIKIRPEMDPETGINSPVITFEVKDSAPKIKGTVMTGFVRDGKIMVNLNDPYGSGDTSQPTLFADTEIISMGQEASGQ
jgi:hypothetical protein